jgi:hypothetical protein
MSEDEIIELERLSRSDPNAFEKWLACLENQSDKM